MDPYKVLGISAEQIKHPSDIGIARKKAKQLYKRFVKEGKKFDGKKVLEAYDMVQQRLKNRPGEGAYKILGRSRKERELDKHFNHQTKEIKKNTHLKRELIKRRKGDRRFRLPGDKERVARPRRRRHRRRRVKPKIAVDVLEGLQRVGGFLAHKSKFTKAIKLLHRWLKDYMNVENREFVFEVLHEVTAYDFLTEDPDARQDVVQVFEYVLSYYKDWFDQAESHRMLGYHWRVATVLACRCFTDDAFMLSNTISLLNGAFGVIEECRNRLSESLAKPEEGMEAKLEDGIKPKLEDDVKSKQADEIKPKFEDDIKPKLEDCIQPKQEDSIEAKLEDAIEPKCEDNVDAKSEDILDDGAKTELEDTRKPRRRGQMAQPVASPSPAAVEALSSGDEIELSSDDEIELSSGDDDDEMVDVDSEEGMVDDVSLSSGSCSAGESSDVEEVEQTVFAVPSISQSLDRIRAAFVARCLGTLFQHRGPMWAKPKIDAFFQDIFYRREVLTLGQQSQVEAWQSRIKTLQKLGGREVGEANNPLEAHRPVVDSREMRTTIDSDSNAWAAKQTFDTRDRFGGSKTLR